MSRASAAFRLSCFYAAVFAAIGVQLPFWPLWLKDKGLTAAEIGIVLAASFLAKVGGNPLIGHVVDRRGDRRLPLLALSLGATVLVCLYGLTDGFAPILLLTCFAMAAFAGIMPVGETLALMITQQHRLQYGRVRLWGSLAFVAVATATGALLVHQSPAILIWLIAAGLALTALAVLFLPDLRVPSGKAPPPMAMLLRSPPFLLFLAAASANQMAHTVYYGFSSIHWRQAGIDNDVIGLLWSLGVVAEIVLFAVAGALPRAVSPAALLLLAGVGGVVRWLVLGLSTDLALLIPAQLLHAATFGCAHLGAMQLLHRMVPQGLAGRAQTLYSAVVMGAAPGLTVFLSGWLYQDLGGKAFLVMAVLSVLSAGFAVLLTRQLRPSHADGGA